MLSNDGLSNSLKAFYSVDYCAIYSMFMVPGICFSIVQSKLKILLLYLSNFWPCQNLAPKRNYVGKSSVSPTTTPPFKHLLDCSLEWSSVSLQNLCVDLWAIKFPFWNSSCTESYTVLVLPYVSQMCTGSHMHNENAWREENSMVLIDLGH